MEEELRSGIINNTLEKLSVARDLASPDYDLEAQFEMNGQKTRVSTSAIEGFEPGPEPGSYYLSLYPDVEEKHGLLEKHGRKILITGAAVLAIGATVAIKKRHRG